MDAIIDQSVAQSDVRYTATAQALHWVTAVLMFTVLPLAWVMVGMKDTSPSRGLLFTLHKSVGLTILALVAARLLWRTIYAPPPLRPFGRWEGRFVLASHWLLYFVMIAMPVSGYLLSAAKGRPVSYFGLFALPALPKSEALSHAADWAHVAVGQWLVYALILLHVLGTAWHVGVRRDGALDRMLPEQKTQTRVV
jgi:cytochrome b561